MRALRLPVFVVAALLSASAGATEFVGPRIALSPVDWTAASAALTEAGDGTPAEQFARLNAATEKRFPGIGKSSVPVLLPIDVEALRKDIAAQKPDADTANRYLAPFHPSSTAPRAIRTPRRSSPSMIPGEFITVRIVGPASEDGGSGGVGVAACVALLV